MSYIGNSPGVASQRVESAFTATASQTVFTPTSGYTLGYCDVYQNGVKLVNGDDYTAANGATVTLTTGATSGDSIVIVASFPRGLSDGYLKSEADAKYVAKTGSTMTGDLVLDNGNADGAQIQLASSGYSNWNLDNYSGRLRAYYGSTEYFTLNASGNLGLGVTPSAWGSGYKALQVNGASLMASSSYAQLGVNNYWNGTNDIYIASLAASYYVQSAGAHKWFNAPSGTAGTVITFTQAMTLDASGNLGIGTTSPSFPLDVVSNSAANAFKIRARSGNDYGFMQFSSNDGATRWSEIFGIPSGLVFTTGSSGTERARIDSSGNLLVGTTSTTITNGGAGVLPAAGETYFSVGHKSGTASGAYYLAAYYNGSIVGGLTQSGTTGIVLTNLSDYRLKDNVSSLQGSLTKILALNPVTYKWKSDGSDGEGFIAHELQTVIPTAATGMQDEVDEEGNAKYQGINLSALVPHLVKAIQEQQAIITQLQADVASLKGQA